MNAPAVVTNAATTTVSPAARSKAEENLRKARVQLVIHQPFFASIVLRRTISIDDTVPTAYVTASGKIVLGTKFVSGLTVAQTVFLLAHEAMHYAMMHQLRRGWRKPKAWNIAADKVINDILKASNVGQEIPDGMYQEGAREFAAEQIYNEQDERGQGSGDQYAPGEGNNDLSEEGASQVDAEQIESIKRELIQAATAAKAQGKMPAGMERVLDELVNPSTPWHQLLERFMLLQIKHGISFRRPNKRFIAHDLYLPSASKAPRMGTVVIQVDESGSIGSRELQHFGGHINKILEMCMPEKTVVFHTDTRVAHVEEFAVEDFPIQLKAYTGGGTNMAAGFDKVEDEGLEPDVFVCLTDGYTPWGEAPGYPVVWLCTTKGIEAPHGETIYYEVTE